MTLDEMLERHIANEDTKQLRLIRDVLEKHAESVQQEGQMAPSFVVKDSNAFYQEINLMSEPGAEEGAGLFNALNRVSNAIRLTEYRYSIRRFPDRSTVVAEGDSWFLHQLLDDTVDHLHSDHFNVRSMAAAGDTVENMLSGTDYIDVLLESKASAFLFSGGGNDLLGGGRIAKVLYPYDDAVPVIELVNDEEFEPLLDRVIAAYENMLSTLAREIPEVCVFSHGYDYIAKIDTGPWLWPHLKKMGYSEDRAAEVTGVLLDRLNTSLAQLDHSYPNFKYVSTLNVVNQNGLSRGSWFDAIHPKSAGFNRVAEKFASAINAFLDEPKNHIREQQGINVSEAIVSSNAGRRDSRSFRHIDNDRCRTNEAITQAYASRNRTDFESVRHEVLNFPPKSEWLRFRDPLVHQHIEDVRMLLEDPSLGQTDEHVATRLRTRPLSLSHESHLGVYGVAAQEQSDDRFDIEFNMLEALFGDSEIEPVQVLLRGYEASRSVGRVQVMNRHGTHTGHGSGFLVAPGLFLTNQHVLEDADIASRSTVIFGDEVHLDGSHTQQVKFKITDQVFWSSKEADYAICSIEPVNRDGQKLSDYGFLPLIQDSGKALNFEPVSIIQHPGGNPKAIAIRNSFVMGRTIDGGVYYTTDTLGGSSGSPVLNREWQVVALHHRFVPHPLERGAVLANRGVRISHIFDDLFREQGRGNLQVRQILNKLMDSESVAEVTDVRKHPVVGERTDELVDSGVYLGLTETEFYAAIAPEHADVGLDVPIPDILKLDVNESSPVDSDSVIRRLGPEGYRFIISHEVSSKAYYDKKLVNPILPGEQSGITIGIGYDLGYKTESEFRENWSDLLSKADVVSLEACIGKKRSAAAALLASVRHVVVPYESAIKVYESDSVPKVYQELLGHFPKTVLDGLPSHCFAALVSLTFNRGASFQNAGDRYREMRNIRDAILGNNLHTVPDLIRSMKRIWAGNPKVRGLLRRRDEEADLFEAGLVDFPKRQAPSHASLGTNCIQAENTQSV